MTYDFGAPVTITMEMAVQIRRWRVDEDFTWRAVAPKNPYKEPWN
ncbi:hypothetical protein AB0M41_26550 [Streptomyces sp. NPDC051896]